MRGTTLALVSCALFGMGFIFKKVLLSSMSPVVITAFTSVFSAAVLFFFMEIFHRIRELCVLCRREFLAIIAVGFFSGFLAEFIFLVGLEHTSVSNAVLLSRTNALFMAFMATIMFREKITWNQIIGSIIMMLGLYVIATEGFSVGLSYRWGDLLLVSSGFLWALGNTIVKRYLDHVPPEVILFGRCLVGGVALLFLSAESFGGEKITWDILLNFLGLVLISTVAAYMLWYKALEMTQESNVGLTAFSIPLFTIISARIFLGEALAGYQMVGGSFILIGLIVLEVHLGQIKSIGGYAKIMRLLHT